MDWTAIAPGEDSGNRGTPVCRYHAPVMRRVGWVVLLVCAACAAPGPAGSAGDRLQELDASDPVIRLAAVRRLLVAREDHREELLAYLRRGTAPGRAWAVFLLGRRGTCEVLVPFLTDADAEVRFRAVEAIGRAGFVADLASRLADPHPVVAVVAAWGLLRRGKDLAAARVLVGALAPSSRSDVAREAHARLTSLFAERVDYDPSRGAAHRIAAQRGWLRVLSARGLALPEDSVGSDPEPPEARKLRDLLVAVRSRGSHDRGELQSLWTAAVTIPGHHVAVARARCDLLGFLLQRLLSEGLLHHRYAWALLRTDQLVAALGHFEKADRLLPREPGLLNDFGVALEAAGRLGAASRRFGSVTRLDPGSVDAWSNLGRVLLRREETDAAIEPLLRAEALDPQRWVRHRRLIGRALSIAE
ncbi:MAG: hypothetical protein CMJ83_12100 [Planctomycetes bacterium]|nr:hypothetical protein [Planctomycetota bacterium]